MLYGGFGRPPRPRRRCVKKDFVLAMTIFVLMAVFGTAFALYFTALHVAPHPSVTIPAPR